MPKTGNKYRILPGLTPAKIPEKASQKGLTRERKHIKPVDRKKLRESQKMFQKLASHLEEIMENERSQIALNLHDDLGQKLTAINMNIAWVKSRIGVQSQAVRKKIEEMSQMINETIESIKEISSFLRPLILFDLGVVPAFDSLLKKFQKQSGIRYDFIYDHEEFQIDKRISLILYRILQESLTNIARHSQASAARVKLRLLRTKIELQINDNGKGIDEDEVNSLTSMGIAGLKERVNSVSGRLLIKGEKGFGTSIKVSIPLIKGNKDD
jgi:signal transduction histidine kinase